MLNRSQSHKNQSQSFISSRAVPVVHVAINDMLHLEQHIVVDENVFLDVFARST
jgi:hypothetical protein